MKELIFLPKKREFLSFSSDSEIADQQFPYKSREPTWLADAGCKNNISNRTEIYCFSDRPKFIAVMTKKWTMPTKPYCRN